MPKGMEVDLDTGHIKLDANQDSSFLSMSVVVKRSPISATAELILMLVLIHF